ncbi:hypothetical protein E1B28_013230 [Marasmius oreades]|uniref:Alcohol dehydrogenase-like C-terminal domain-containing protein n=1 Tax=Marasmius oreades TaxID=181124 RepID=A0A9P7RPA7_9AGAR|nr:uncharacterized protein E1B28_013230 [Marasmius oreades]KAG7087249.1 hypothetical protein E1B28_013230 [Marasmius oreades]
MGGFLIKSLYFSIDPSLRSRLGLVFQEGETIFNWGIGVVLRSEHPEVKFGDRIEGVFNFEEYTIRYGMKGDTAAQCLTRVENRHKLPWSVFVGAIGISGKTAYYGWKEFSHAKAGEVVYVSTGAGAVGSIVIQLAKRDGLKVIASAGSEEKVKLLKDIGVDVAFNYKTTKTSDVLQKEGPIDIYWDNVGGEMLESSLDASSNGARIIICGAISGYNSGNAQPIRNLVQLIYKSITLYGLYVYEYDHKYREEFYQVMPDLIAKGEIKYAEDVTIGLEKVGETILAQQKGLNTGKSIIKVTETE